MNTRQKRERSRKTCLSIPKLQTNDVAVYPSCGILSCGEEDSIGSTPRQVLCCFSASQALTMIFRNLCHHQRTLLDRSSVHFYGQHNNSRATAPSGSGSGTVRSNPAGVRDHALVPV